MMEIGLLSSEKNQLIDKKMHKTFYNELTLIENFQAS